MGQKLVTKFGAVLGDAGSRGHRGNVPVSVSVSVSVVTPVLVVTPVAVVTPRPLVGPVVGVDGHEAQRAQELGEFEAPVAVGVGFAEELHDVLVDVGVGLGGQTGSEPARGSPWVSPGLG